jgi:hypothetical protein
MESPEYLGWLGEQPEHTVLMGATTASRCARWAVSLCRSLTTAGLVDRFRVVVFPVVTGATGQDRIYDGYPDIRLDLVESRTF